MLSNEILKTFCEKMQNDGKKSSLKNWFSRILNINVMKTDYVCVETNVFVIEFYSVYLVYYAHNIVYLQYKITILLAYCIEHIRIFNKQMKCFMKKSQFVKSTFSVCNCTMIVVEEILVYNCLILEIVQYYSNELTNWEITLNEAIQIYRTLFPQL